MHSGRISSADKNLVAIAVGCLPGTGVMDIGGYYLIYDASKDSLSVVPKLLDHDFHAAIGCQSAVVMCNGDDGGCPFSCPTRLAQAGILPSSHLAVEVVRPRIRMVRAGVPSAGFLLSPVFLLSRIYPLLGGSAPRHGNVCDLGNDPKLCFIQLPKDCPSYDSDDTWNRYHICPDKFRSMTPSRTTPSLPSPGFPYDHSHRAIGCESAVVMCAPGNHDYILAELVKAWPECSEAALWLWRSSVKKWALHPSRLPLPSNFSSNLCFSCRGSILCWVDLLKGMVLCDLKQNCNFSFIPLPKYCPTYSLYSNKYRYGSAEEFRSMACVDGEIMFVALDEYDKHQPELQASKGLYLTIWTLSHDLSGWKESHKYNVENIWANEAYKPAGVRNLPPSLPVLSIHEDGVVYLVLNDLRELDHGLEYVGQWMVRVDIGNDKVQFYPLVEENSVTSQLVAIEFSVHRQHL
ncbi:hypothetical protein ZWY2020_046191 [Hordeum vulgare]|nr:hypothetical protein ZWY2020_046191 [Hordeum vulgare]